MRWLVVWSDFIDLFEHQRTLMRSEQVNGTSFHLGITWISSAISRNCKFPPLSLVFRLFSLIDPLCIYRQRRFMFSICSRVYRYACAQALACRARVTPASSHASPCSGEVLTTPAFHACGCISPFRSFLVHAIWRKYSVLAVSMWAARLRHIWSSRWIRLVFGTLYSIIR